MLRCGMIYTPFYGIKCGLEMALRVPLKRKFRLGPWLPHWILPHGRSDPNISLEQVISAIRLLKRGKAVGSSLMMVEMLQASGEKRTQQIRDLIICLLRISDAMMTSSNGNIFRVTGPLCGEFTGHRWIPHTKAREAGLWYFLWPAPE